MALALAADFVMDEEPQVYEVPQCAHAAEEAEEHPLQWLQPTPPHSPMALYLPIAWNVSFANVDAEAMSSTSHDSAVCVRETISDASTTFSEDHDAFQDELSEDGNSGIQRESAAVMAGIFASGLAGEFVVPPPQVAPSISWMSSSPPPPPSCAPSSSFIVPPRRFDELVSFQQLTNAFSSQPCSENRAARTLLAAAGSFTDLSSWTVACTSIGGFAEERFGMVDHTITAEPALQPFAFSRGSALHSTGKCKPCAFVHRPVGCVDGTSCSFCHVCAPGEKKRRQRSKLEVVRLRRELRRTVPSAGSAEVSGEGKGTTSGCADAR